MSSATKDFETININAKRSALKDKYFFQALATVLGNCKSYFFNIR